MEDPLETYEWHGETGLEKQVLRIGKGKHPVLAFHGFGREASDFKQFYPMLAEGEYLLSVNLFQHGKSTWPQEKSKIDGWDRASHRSWILSLLEKEGVDSFSLLGYSMGGRIALCTLEDFPTRVKQTLLIAPDGLKINRLYAFAAGTSLGRWIYRGIIRDPSPLFWTADNARKLKLIDEKLRRFVYVHLEDKDLRQKVYDSWLIYSDFQPNLDRLAKIVAQGTSFKLLFGAFDSVIKPALGKKFQEQVGSKKVFHTIESGHQLMRKETVVFIQEKGLWVVDKG